MAVLGRTSLVGEIDGAGFCLGEIDGAGFCLGEIDGGTPDSR